MEYKSYIFDLTSIDNFSNFAGYHCKCYKKEGILRLSGKRKYIETVYLEARIYPFPITKDTEV